MTLKHSQRLRQRQTATNDGLQNLVLKIGEGSTVMGGARYVPNGLSQRPQQLEQLYRGSWIVGKVVDAPAEDMTSAGIDLRGVEPESGAKLQRQLTRKGVWAAITEVLKWGRLYGGAALVLNIRGQDLQSPLRLETIGKGAFERPLVFDRWRIMPDPTVLVTGGPNLGNPEFYTVPALGLRIHHSRVLRFLGVKLPWTQAQTESGWGMSVVERLFDRIVPFDTATLGTAQLVSKAHLRTVRVENLREILSQGGVAEENLIKMFALVGRLQSSEGITLLDKLDEYSAQSYTFAGLGDVLTQFAQQIAGASGIPLVRLLGQSPAGLNSSGESDIATYHEGIRQSQENDLRLPMLMLCEALHWSEKGTAPEEDFDFEFRPLKQPDDKTKGETAKVMVEAISAAYGDELIDQATAMRELQHVGAITGMFTNITDEAIEEAEEADKEAKSAPPVPANMTLDPLGELGPDDGNQQA